MYFSLEAYNSLLISKWFINSLWCHPHPDFLFLTVPSSSFLLVDFFLPNLLSSIRDLSPVRNIDRNVGTSQNKALECFKKHCTKSDHSVLELYIENSLINKPFSWFRIEKLF